MKMDKDVKELFKLEIQIKRGLKRMLDEQKRMMEDHKRWLRQHDVRLDEHWKHIRRPSA